MMEKELISIIVPIYNVEKYLDRCVNSLVKQTYQNLEIILVDDGSTDHCPEICDKWASYDQRIVALHQENGGIGGARNAGIEYAHGQYLSFVDADDFVDETFIQVLFDTMVSTNCKMSVIGFQFFFEEEKIGIDRNQKWDIRLYTTEEALTCLFAGGGQFSDYAWNKMCHRELFSSVRYPVKKRFEDVGTTYLLLDQCDQVAYYPAPLYFYCQRSNSVMHTWDKGLELDYFEMSRKRYRYLRDRHPGLLVNNFSFFTNIFNCFPYFSKEARKQAITDAAELWETVKPFCSLKTKIKYYAIQTVPGLYAWNKRRNNKRSHERDWTAGSPEDVRRKQCEMEKQWLADEVRRDDPLKYIQKNGPL